MKKNGFAPIEALIVVVLLVILAAIFFPNYQRANKRAWFKNFYAVEIPEDFKYPPETDNRRPIIQPFVTAKLAEMQSELSRLELERESWVTTHPETPAEVKVVLEKLDEFNGNIATLKTFLANAQTCAKYFGFHTDPSIKTLDGAEK